MLINKKDKAFTLAETLIALAIIGVIAAITVPTLIQNTQKQEYVSALKKAYSTLSQATQQIIAEEGSPKNNWADSSENVAELYKKYLNVLKDCGTGSGCFRQTAESGYRNLNEGNSGSWDNNSFTKIILSDGMQIGFSAENSVDCSKTAGGSLNVCAFFYIDINGEKKPNQIGRDVFVFALKENSLSPAGCELGVCPNSSGYDCACKVLKEGAMNY